MNDLLPYSWHSATAPFYPGVLTAVRSRLALSPTPFVLVDPQPAIALADALATKFTAVRYAVKAGPHVSLIRSLIAAGHGFDVASSTELDLVLSNGAAASSLVASHPAMPASDLTHCLRGGVRLFVVDHLEHVELLLSLATSNSIELRDVRLLVRLDFTDPGAHFPLASKFGAHLADATSLAQHLHARKIPLAGVAFHLGSQASSTFAATTAATNALTFALEHCESPVVIDVGGGFPAPYPGAASWQPFADALAQPLASVTTLCEPGRLLASAGTVLAASVVSVATRQSRRDVHLDAGAYHGLMEFSRLLAPSFTTDVAALTNREPGPTTLTRLVGPTCDALDVIFAHPVPLPPLEVGDVLVFNLAGAYATSLSSPFNGFATPQDFEADFTPARLTVS